MSNQFLCMTAFCLSTLLSYSQTSISAGVAKRSDKLTNGGAFEQLFLSATPKRYQHDYFSLSFEYKKKRFLAAAELLYTHSKTDIESVSGYSVGGTTYHTHHSSRYNFTANFHQLGVKLIANPVFFHESAFNLAAGPFVQFDFSIHESESDHYHWYRYSHSEQTYNPVTQTYGSNSTVTVTESTDEFDGYILSNPLFSVGLSLRPRYQFNQFIVEANLSAGLGFSERIQENYADSKDAMHEYGGPNLFSEVGLKVGYILPSKEAVVGEN